MPVNVGLINPYGLANEALTMKGLVPDFAADELKRRALAIQSQQEQRLTAEQQTKQQRLAEYQADLVELNKDPSDQKVANFMMKWPEFSTGTGAAYKVTKDAKRDAKVEQVGGIISAIDSDLPTAIRLVQESMAADEAAKHPVDTLAQSILADLQSGQEDKIKEAKAAAKVMLARSMGTKEFGDALGVTPDPFQRKHEYIKSQNRKLGDQFLATSAQGPPQPVFDQTTGQILGYTRTGNLQEFGGEDGEQSEREPFQSEDGKITGEWVKDASGRKTLVSPQFNQPLPYVVTQQDYDAVGPGKPYIASFDDDLHTKPAQ